MRKLGLLFLVLVASVAVARPAYRLALIEQFHLVPDKDGVRTVTCQYCHINPGGGPGWNPFGELVRSNLKTSINQALYDALAEMKDSSGNGYPDVLKVFAGFLPGDPNSKPLVSVDFLMQAFLKAGGLDIYKPK